jgi:hypothetical protein
MTTLNKAQELLNSNDSWAIFASGAEYKEGVEALVFSDGSKLKTREALLDDAKTINDSIYYEVN